MSLTSYSDLKSAIATWMDRTDLTAAIDGFIDLAEARHRREVRLAAQEQTSTITLTDGVGDLPSAYVEFRSVRLNSNPPDQLHYMTPDKLFSEFADYSGVGSNFTIRGDKIIVRPVPSNTITLTYYAAFTALSDTNVTNELLSQHPDVYLYSALVEACAYTVEEQRGLVYEAKYQNALQRAIRSDRAGRWSTAPSYSMGPTP